MNKLYNRKNKKSITNKNKKKGGVKNSKKKKNSSTELQLLPPPPQIRVYQQGISDCCFWAIRVAYEHVTKNLLDNDKWLEFTSIYGGEEDLTNVLVILRDEIPEISEIKYVFHSAYDDGYVDFNTIKSLIDDGHILILKTNCMTFAGGNEEQQNYTTVDEDPIVPKQKSFDNHCITCIGYSGDKLICRDSNINYDFMDGIEVDSEGFITKWEPNDTGKHNVKTISSKIIDKGAKAMITHDENGNWTASKKDGGKTYDDTNFRVFHISDMLLVSN